jgi:hypothetical protein
MDRAKLIGSLVIAGLLAGTGVAVADTPVMQAPSLSATLETCQTSALPAQRVASFVGSMPAMSGAERMQMRFDLQRRQADEKLWHRLLGVQGFGVWESALPGRAGFVFHKRVDGLQVPASYRAIVHFRWTGANGTIVRRARKRTAVCNQPDLRPDLTGTGLRAVLDARPALAVYTLVVRNDGQSAAGPFAVTVAGAVREVAGLAAGQQLELSVVAPACVPGAPVRAVVDADRRVDEADEHNALRRACPLPPS